MSTCIWLASAITLPDHFSFLILQLQAADDSMDFFILIHTGNYSRVRCLCNCICSLLFSHFMQWYNCHNLIKITAEWVPVKDAVYFFFVSFFLFFFSMPWVTFSSSFWTQHYLAAHGVTEEVERKHAGSLDSDVNVISAEKNVITFAECVVEGLSAGERRCIQSFRGADTVTMAV